MTVITESLRKFPKLLSNFFSLKQFAIQLGQFSLLISVAEKRFERVIKNY